MRIEFMGPKAAVAVALLQPENARDTRMLSKLLRAFDSSDGDVLIDDGETTERFYLHLNTVVETIDGSRIPNVSIKPK